MVAPRKYDASEREGDVEEYVETEVGSKAFVVARGVATLENLEKSNVLVSSVHRRETRVPQNYTCEAIPMKYTYLWCSHVACSPRDESHGESSRLLGLSGDVA